MSNQYGPVTEEVPVPTKNPARNILIVLHSMIRVIPDQCEEKFKCDLERQLTKGSYVAPENVYTVWRNVQNIITERFNAHNDKSTLPKWCELLLDIWTDNKTVP